MLAEVRDVLLIIMSWLPLLSLISCSSYVSCALLLLLPSCSALLSIRVYYGCIFVHMLIVIRFAFGSKGEVGPNGFQGECGPNVSTNLSSLLICYLLLSVFATLKFSPNHQFTLKNSKNVV